MRPALLAAFPFLLAAGCLSPVYGEPPEKACSQGTVPATSYIVGAMASWAGRSFTATGDGVTLWVEGVQADFVSGGWWGESSKAWAVAAVSNGNVLEARAGLVQYGAAQTTIHVGPAGQSIPSESNPMIAEKLIGPVALSKGQTIFVVGSADNEVSSLNLLLRWEGCGATGEVLFGSGDGFVVGWGDLDGSLVLSNTNLGTAAYEASFEDATPEEGIVLAQPPPGGDSTGQNEATVTTSGGKTSLAGLQFFVHTGGAIRYDVRHFGETGEEPLFAFLPARFSAA